MATGVTQTLFAQALARATGLTYQASLAWASAEVGKLNNLGIMAGGQPVAYASPAAGAKAAAELIASSSLYAGIRASVGGTAQQQMDAIARSPWHLGPTGLANAGGVDPYYARVFSSFGYTPGANAAPATSSPSSSSNGNLGAWGDIVSFPVGHIVTSADVDTMLSKLTAAGFFGHELFGVVDTLPGIAARDQTRQLLQGAIGQPWGKPLQDQLQGQFGMAATKAGDPLGIGAFLATIPGLAVGGAVLILVLVLAYSGVEDLLGAGGS